jgi:hypothetical protein
MIKREGVETIPIEVSIPSPTPKSSPKRIATKKMRGAAPERLSLSARLLKIRALTGKNLRNSFIYRHFPHPAFYSAGEHDPLLAAL